MPTFLEEEISKEGDGKSYDKVDYHAENSERKFLVAVGIVALGVMSIMFVFS